MEIKAKAKRQLIRQRIDKLEFKNASLENEDYGNQKVDKFTAINSKFRRCRFENITIGDAGFGEGERMSIYIECSFDGAKFKAPAPGNARFERCSFKDVDIRDFFCRAVEFVDCVFSGKLKKCFFNGSVPNNSRKLFYREINEFTGNDFEHALFDDVDFRSGIDLEQQNLHPEKMMCL